MIGPTLLAAVPDMHELSRWRQALFWLAILAFIFFIAAWVIARFSKRFRAYLLREPRRPTPDGDVWAMHRLPEEEPPEAEEDSLDER